MPAAPEGSGLMTEGGPNLGGRGVMLMVLGEIRITSSEEGA